MVDLRPCHIETNTPIWFQYTTIQLQAIQIQNLGTMWLIEDCSTVFVYLPAENITSLDFNITSPGVHNLHYLGTLFNMGVSNFL